MIEPKWLSEVHQDSGLTSRDVMEIFGIKSCASLYVAIKNGSIPRPNYDTSGYSIFGGVGSRSKRIWIVRDIRKAIQKQNKKAKDPQ